MRTIGERIEWAVGVDGPLDAKRIDRDYARAMSFRSWLGLAPKRRTLTVSIVTRDSEKHLAECIGDARRYADEVVVGVDAGSTDKTWEIAEDLADVAYRFTHPNQLAPAHVLSFDYCTGDFVLRLDDDEMMEPGFEGIVHELIATDRFTHYYLPRKWVVSTKPPAYVHASPWYPNLALRLVKNDRSIVWKPPRYHSGFLVQGPYAIDVRFAILHFEPVWCSPEKRVGKLEAYRIGGGNGAAEEYYGTKADVVRPFRASTTVRPSRPRRQRIDRDVHALEVRPFAPWGCRIESVDMPRTIRIDESVIVSAKMTNTGAMSWSPSVDAGRWPEVNLGLHLRSVDGTTIVHDLGRIRIATPARPGDTITVVGVLPSIHDPGDFVLAWDLVSENECWFESCGSVPFTCDLTVVAPDAPTST